MFNTGVIENLNVSELQDLVALAIEANLCAPNMKQPPVHAYAGLAAKCNLELLSRQKAKPRLRGTRARAVGSKRRRPRAPK